MDQTARISLHFQYRQKAKVKDNKLPKIASYPAIPPAPSPTNHHLRSSPNLSASPSVPAGEALSRPTPKNPQEGKSDGFPTGQANSAIFTHKLLFYILNYSA
jgi:hypothetical protein